MEDKSRITTEHSIVGGIENKIKQNKTDRLQTRIEYR